MERSSSTYLLSSLIIWFIHALPTSRFQSQRLSDQLAMEVKQMCNIVQQGMERIILVDAVGNRIPIPMQLCQTYSVRADASTHYIRLFAMK
jgi:hypothetical protein